jgi:hypothetical protein
MPADPMTEVAMGHVAVAEWYRQLRAGGMPVLAAACFLAATVKMNAQDPDPG